MCVCVIEHYLGVKFALMDPSSPLKRCHRELQSKCFKTTGQTLKRVQEIFEVVTGWLPALLLFFFYRLVFKTENKVSENRSFTCRCHLTSNPYVLPPGLKSRTTWSAHIPQHQ